MIEYDENGAVSILIKAVSFAALKHKDQCRKDASASPYINHPIVLASVLREEGDICDGIIKNALMLQF